MHEITVYRVGERLDLEPFAEAAAFRLQLVPGVRLTRSPHSGRYAFFRMDGTFGLDLKAALKAEWCKWAPEGGAGLPL